MLERSFKIKIGIFFIITIMAVSFFSINWYVILQFRKQLNQQVQTLANIYHDKVTTENIDSDYLIKTLLPLIDDLDIPIVITTKQSDATINYEYLNLDISSTLNKEEEKLKLQDFVYSMDKINNPLPILIIDKISPPLGVALPVKFVFPAEIVTLIFKILQVYNIIEHCLSSIGLVKKSA